MPDVDENNISIGSIGDLIQAIRAIKAMDRQIEVLQADMSAMVQWYNERVANMEAQKGRMEGLIDGYLEFTGRKNVPTPSGTAFKRSFDKWEWPEDGVLIQWANENNKPEFIKTTQIPARSVIKNALREGTIGDPPGLRRTTQSKIVIGRPGEIPDENKEAGNEGNGGGSTEIPVIAVDRGLVNAERAA